MIALKIYFELESLSLTHTIHASYDEDTKRKKDILMKTITIFGKGNMGTAIGGLFEDAGNKVSYIGSKDTADTLGDIVVLAVNYPVIAGILDTYKEALKGKIIIDISNPVNTETFDGLVVPADASAAAVIADLVAARVVKGFNVNFAASLSNKKVGDNTTTVLLALDDHDAKEDIIKALDGSGVRVKDAGSLKRARELEAIGFLQIKLAASENISWNNGFALID